MQRTHVALLSLMAAALSPVAQADWSVTPIAGLNVGYFDLCGEFNSRGSATTFDNNIFITDADVNVVTKSGCLGANSFTYGVLAGLDVHCKRWVLGTDFNVTWQPHTPNKYAERENISFTPRTFFVAQPVSFIPGNDTIILDMKYQRDTTMTLSERIGYSFCDGRIIPYIRLGVETSRDYLFGRVALDESGDVGYFDGSKRSFRFVAGAGTAISIQKFLPNTYLTGEYTYVSRGEGVSADGFIHTPYAQPLTGTPFHIQANPKSYRLQLGLVYHFV